MKFLIKTPLKILVAVKTQIYSSHKTNFFARNFITPVQAGLLLPNNKVLTIIFICKHRKHNFVDR